MRQRLQLRLGALDSFVVFVIFCHSAPRPRRGQVSQAHARTCLKAGPPHHERPGRGCRYRGTSLGALVGPRVMGRVAGVGRGVKNQAKARNDGLHGHKQFSAYFREYGCVSGGRRAGSNIDKDVLHIG